MFAKVAERALEVAEWCSKVHGRRWRSPRGTARARGSRRGPLGDAARSQRGCWRSLRPCVPGGRLRVQQSLRGEARAVRVAGGRGGMQQGRRGVAGGRGGERNSEGSWEAAERCSEAAEGMAGGCGEGSWRSLRGEARAVRVAGGRGGRSQCSWSRVGVGTLLLVVSSEGFPAKPRGSGWLGRNA